MRYYAGTWAYSIWLFKDDAKLKVDEHVTKTSPSVEWQLSVLYDDHTYKSMLSRLIGFRMLHTPSRLINRLYIFLPMGLHLTQSVTPAVLIAYGQQHIAERAVQPKKIYFLDELPLTAVGKVFKPKLADLQTMEVCLEELEALDLFNELDLQVKLTTDRGRVTFIKATSKDGQNHSGAIRGALSDYTFAFEVL